MSSTHPADRSSRTRHALVWIIGGAVIGALAGLVGGFASPRLGPASNGDPALAADVRAALLDDRGYATLSAARWRDSEPSYAGLGAGPAGPPTPTTAYELGSITKTFTGHLLADGVRRGELRLDDPLSAHLSELIGSAAGAVTLRQLATHTAGLPPFPDAVARRVPLKVLANQNLYDGSTAALIEATRTTSVRPPGEYRYSNLGVALLGHAEARAAGAADWPTLATDRLLRPLGMSATSFALDAAAIPVTTAPPQASNGWPAPHWYGPAFAPAGSSTWTTAEDLLRYAQAVLDGTAPGSAALDPVQPIPGGEIGLAWHVTEVDGRAVTWHNGGTGGYRTILALDRERDQAVVLLGNSTRAADAAGLQLAATATGAEVRAVDRSTLDTTELSWSVVALILLISFAATMLRPKHRLGLVTALLSGLIGVVVLLAHGPWTLLPGWLWSAVTGVCLVLAGLGLRRWPRLPAQAERRRAWGWLSLAVTLAAFGVTLWTV